MNQILNLYTRDKWPAKTIARNLNMPEDVVRMHLRAYGIDIKKKHKRNYPKTKKKVVYKNTQKYQLLQNHPESYIKETWIEYGQYKGSDILNCSPKVLWHLAKERGWKRPLPDHLVQASRTGNWNISENYYIKEETNEQHS